MGALYAFCFAPPGFPADLSFADSGWEDPVFVDAVAGIAVIASEVPRERFEGADAELRLGDLDWLLPRVAAHDRVVAQAMTQATVFPLRFGTLFSSRPALAAETAGRRHLLLDFFSRMAGREEWAVKALLDRERAIAARLLALHPDLADGPAGGRDYLIRQRRRSEAEQAIEPWLRTIIADLDRRLDRCCEAVLPRPAQEPAVASRACLIEAAAAAALRAEIEQASADYAGDGIVVHCSGPWPLYSFCAAS